ncbi:hypothetical protein FRB90_001796, partial [Tulasnella sp. 427]
QTTTTTKKTKNLVPRPHQLCAPSPTPKNQRPGKARRKRRTTTTTTTATTMTTTTTTTQRVVEIRMGKTGKSWMMSLSRARMERTTTTTT